VKAFLPLSLIGRGNNPKTSESLARRAFLPPPQGL